MKENLPEVVAAEKEYEDCPCEEHFQAMVTLAWCQMITHGSYNMTLSNVKIEGARVQRVTVI